MSTNDDTTKRHLEDAVAEAWSQPQVEVFDEDTYAVTVPGHRYQHDALTLVVSWSRDERERPWLISDDGYTAFLLGDRYEQLADLLQDSPLIDGRVSESAITLRSADESIGDAIVSFARELTGLLVAANTLEAYVAARRADTSTASPETSGPLLSSQPNTVYDDISGEAPPLPTAQSSSRTLSATLTFDHDAPPHTDADFVEADA